MLAGTVSPFCSLLIFSGCILERMMNQLILHASAVLDGVHLVG